MSRASKAKNTKAQFISFDWNIPSFLSLPKITRQLDEDVRKEVIIVPAETVIAGSVSINNSGGKSLAYDSVVVELQGVVETTEDQVHRLPFFTVAKIVKGAGTLTYPETFSFDFSGNPLPCETINAHDAAFCIKYFLVCTLKSKTGNYSGDMEFACMKYLPKPLETIPIRTEIGVEDTLQLELELCNTFLDISRDLLIGRVHFVHAAKKLEEMSIIIRRRELFKKSKSSTEWFASPWHDIHYYDIMEGAPTREEVIPFRIYMANLQLSPSFSTDIAKIEYAVVLSLVDSENRSYFRSHDLTLYRGYPDNVDHPEQTTNAPGIFASNISYGDQPTNQSQLVPQMNQPNVQQYGTAYGNNNYGVGLAYGMGSSYGAPQQQGQGPPSMQPQMSQVPQMNPGPYGAPAPPTLPSAYGVEQMGTYKVDDPGLVNPYGAQNYGSNPYGSSGTAW